MAAAEAESARQEQIIQAEAAMQVQHATVIATFAKRAKDATIIVGATTEEAEAAGQAASAEAETSFADSIAMQE